MVERESQICFIGCWVTRDVTYAMHIRFYIDPVSGTPDIYNHDISESEVEKVLSAQRKTGRVMMALGAPSAKQAAGGSFA